MKEAAKNWKNGIVVPVMLALTLAGGMLFVQTNDKPAIAVGEEQVNTITVSGNGEVTITPDVAYLQFGLNTEGKTAQEAQQKNAQLFAKIQEEIKKQGVANADITTVRYDTQPDYRWEKEQNVLKGYRSEHIVEVAYRKMDAIGSLLDSITKAGANRIETIRFGTEKENEYEIKALENAMEHAKKKAEALAVKSEKTLKGVLSIQEAGTSAPPVMYREAKAMKAEAAMLDAATEINEGQLKITRVVQVTYEF